MPLLTSPDREWKSAAFSQYQRVIPGYGRIARGMGYTMRTDQYRFTRWMVPGTDFEEFELYDHQSDPDENVNLANERRFQGLLPALKERMKGGYRESQPDRR